MGKFFFVSRTVFVCSHAVFLLRLKPALYKQWVKNEQVGDFLLRLFLSEKSLSCSLELRLTTFLPRRR